jgi:RecB family endonuclease NucS
MTKGVKKRRRERRVQKLLCDHPYLLDKELLNCRGRTERRIASGRLDIDFETECGWIVVECKITPLCDADIRQLSSYLDDLRQSGKAVYKAYLVGGKPRRQLSDQLLSHPPGIRVVRLLHDIPTSLALSEGRHYFDAELDVCPYDGTRRIPGKELEIEY